MRRPQVAQFFKSYFTAKSEHKPAVTTDYFSEQHLTYIDATLGWPFYSKKDRIISVKLMHVVGSDQGGGFEWTNNGSSVKRGVVAIDLDGVGQIVRLVTTWDNGILSDSELQALVLLSIENDLCFYGRRCPGETRPDEQLCRANAKRLNVGFGSIASVRVCWPYIRSLTPIATGIAICVHVGQVPKGNDGGYDAGRWK